MRKEEGEGAVKNAGQKLKILYLMKILQEQTDEEHKLSMPQLIEELARLGLRAERKSIYDDLEALRSFGLDVEYSPGAGGGYYIANRAFQLPELKLLVDSVLASKFITSRKTSELVEKLEKLASVHQARELNRQVLVNGRSKSMNESVYYNVDSIHSAINQDLQISFRYFDYTVEKSRCYRRNGACYVVSPLALLWEEEKYYLIAYESEKEKLKHYRVEKMEGIRLLDAARQGLDVFPAEELPCYSKKFFSMFGGEERELCLRFSNQLVGVVLDRFGKDIPLLKDGDSHFRINVSLQMSPQFYGWVFSLGKGISILSPQDVLDAFRQRAREAMDV
ncbi:MAG: WYL domain-containing protein [Bacillota bacterium]|nr:WYL domain-containing protein [Bacillota bacterium]